MFILLGIYFGHSGKVKVLVRLRCKFSVQMTFQNSDPYRPCLGDLACLFYLASTLTICSPKYYQY